MVSFDEKDRFAVARDSMVREQLMARGISDSAVLQLFREIRREEFVPEKYQSQAYADNPLPIGIGQTISQPFIVALMTQYLKLDKNCDVLEIGTGSGYQTAILAKLAKKVYTVERFNQLSEAAQAVLARLGIENIEYYIGDGSCGWGGGKQFDRIIITAAIREIPQPIIDQLCESGIVIAPVGDEFSQDLVVCRKSGGRLTYKSVCPCRFVKLIGKYGFTETE
ncbi:unnamed protein product [marine sediment metagenome]|uniref:protein-L-isoaspartate(D-aspartate) O-methyltransferase n=1 Tax=marine sediment metagenome TaxID=412755 RepID=X0SM39_9ZZZZ